MKIRDKIILLDDFMDTENGQEYKKGQTGIVAMKVFDDWNCVAIEFDGYEESKERQNYWIKETGEGANIVPYLAFIPKDIIEINP